MGANASRGMAQLDVSAQVTLRDGDDAAETATATETAVSLNELRDAYWQNHEIPHGKMVVVFNVIALNLSTNTYTMALLVDDVSAMNNTPVAVDSFPVTTVGQYRRIVDCAAIPQLDSDHNGLDKWMASRVTVAGTPDSPSIQYACWIERSLGA